MAKEKKKQDTVKTALGEEKLVTKRVKVLSLPWTTYEPSPLQEGHFIATEHRATRGDVIEVPESVAANYERPDIDAFFSDSEVAGDNTDEESEITPLSQMSQAELINWHRQEKPNASEVVEAASGDADLARRLLEAENAATGGDPRDSVVQGLSEVIARSNV